MDTLVVDDDYAVAGVHRGFLEVHGGFDVVGVAHTGVDALRLADDLAPHLVLLDIYLPDMNGLEVLTELRRRDGEPTDVIAITAARELPTVRAAMAGGVWGYLVKPFSAAVLNDRLDAYLRHRRELARTVAGPAGLDQEQVDRLLDTPAPSRTWSSLPKGLSVRTMDLVATALAGVPGDMSARDVATAVGLSRVSARRYLEFLESSGRVTVTPRYGHAGRPENRYLWSGTSGK